MESAGERRFPPSLRPPPAPAGRPDRAPVVIVAILVPLLVAGIVGLMWHARSAGGLRTPEACSLLSQAQVQLYVPGAVPGQDGDAYYCPWGAPDGARLIVAVETLPGERPRVSDAEEEYDVRRRQAGVPGTTTTPLSSGDESFLACGARDCTTYTRVKNVVFSLELENSTAAAPVRVLAALAVQRLRQAS
jgi:hypothetical protein